MTAQAFGYFRLLALSAAFDAASSWIHTEREKENSRPLILYSGRSGCQSSRALLLDDLHGPPRYSGNSSASYISINS